jgi:hypothetical protein
VPKKKCGPYSLSPRLAKFDEAALETTWLYVGRNANHFDSTDSLDLPREHDHDSHGPQSGVNGSWPSCRVHDGPAVRYLLRSSVHVRAVAAFVFRTLHFAFCVSSFAFVCLVSHL